MTPRNGLLFWVGFVTHDYGWMGLREAEYIPRVGDMGYNVWQVF